MADTNVSAVLSFVKKYPITLCGLSLLFMPSVHRLLLFFTPLLLSTALFFLAIFIWGPNSTSSSERHAKRNVLMKIDDEWTTNDLKDVMVGKAFHLERGTCSAELDDSELNVEPDPDLKVEQQDPDLHVQHVEPDPDLRAEQLAADPADLHAPAAHVEPQPHSDVLHVEHVEPHHVEPDPDLHVEQVAEPDPDLHGEHVESDPDWHEEHVELPDPDLTGEDKTASRDGHHNLKRRILFSDDPKLAKAVERELAGLEASLSSSLNRSCSGSSMEDETQDRDKVAHSKPSGRKAGFPHQKAVSQALEAAA